jgi:hypothetical protein
LIDYSISSMWFYQNGDDGYKTFMLWYKYDAQYAKSAEIKKKNYLIFHVLSMYLEIIETYFSGIL